MIIRTADGKVILGTVEDKRRYVRSMTPVFNLLDFADSDPELFQVFLDENRPAVNKFLCLLKNNT